MDTQTDCATTLVACDPTRAAVGPVPQLAVPTRTDMTSLGKDPRASATDQLSGDEVLRFISFDGRNCLSRPRRWTSGHPGIMPPLLAAGARIILPDMRGCGVSAKPRDASAYANFALARDVIALIEHLRLDSVDVVGFSAGALTALRLLTLKFGAIRSAVIAGIGDYVVEGATLDFPQYFPVPKHLPQPLTNRIWAEEEARVLEGGEIIPGHLASANLIAARILGSDRHLMAAMIRGSVAEPMQVASLNANDVPVLVLNGRADVVNQNTSVLLREIPAASLAQCKGDHRSTPYEPTFHAEILNFLHDRWRKS